MFISCSTTRSCLAHCFLLLSYPFLAAAGFTAHGTRTTDDEQQQRPKVKRILVKKNTSTQEKQRVPLNAYYGYSNSGTPYYYSNSNSSSSSNHVHFEPPSVAPAILQHLPATTTTNNNNYKAPTSSYGSPVANTNTTSPAVASSRPRTPRIFAYPDGTFVMCLFKLALPIPFCQAPDSPCKREKS